MGCGQSKRTQESIAVDKQMKTAAKEMARSIKLLLLGAGESGKSTFAKQMRIVHVAGFSDEEREHFKELIHENIVYAARGLMEAASHLNLSFKKDTQSSRDAICSHEQASLPPNAKKVLPNFFEDPVCTEILDKHYNIVHLLDSTQYYIQELDRILAEDYVPTVQDLLRCRAKTTGIQELHMTIENSKFIIVDVGGQRSERKKWIHCFQDVTAVLFFVAMSEYDLYLYEDEETNRMHESLKLFDEICNSKWFHSIPIVLFLNKKDLFREKIHNVNITVAFPDYDGEQSYQAASDYICDQFLALNENPQKEVFAHKTQATDTNNIKTVFDDVTEIVVGRALEEVGL